METIKVLLDSGASATLINEQFVKGLKTVSNIKTKWNTTAGNFHTGTMAKIEFTLPELNEQRIITKRVHITKAKMGYGMIIGMDLLRELGIDLINSSATIQWDDAEIPMRPRVSDISDSYYIKDPPSVKEQTERINRILDAKYEKADLRKVVNQANLTKEQGKALHELLTKYQSLFDGTLGKWKGDPHIIHLKNDITLYYGKVYKIPYAYEATLKLEVNRLCDIGVLKKVNHSQWASPCFVIPKKDGTVRFLTDLREVNKRIKRYPFPIPNIQVLLMKLKAFSGLLHWI